MFCSWEIDRFNPKRFGSSPLVSPPACLSMSLWPTEVKHLGKAATWEGARQEIDSLVRLF